MAKKVVFVLILAAAAAGIGFAQEGGKKRLFSAGAGLIGVNNRTSLTQKYRAEQTDNDYLADERPYKYDKLKKSSNLNDIGAFLFFDATYAEVNLSISGGKAAYIRSGEQLQALSATKLGLGLFGKYPFRIGKSALSIAPMAGIQYDIVLSAKTEYGNPIKKGNRTNGTGLLLYDGWNAPRKEGSAFDFSTLAFKLGEEARYPLGEKLYLNAQWLYGITLNSAQMSSRKKYYEDNADHYPNGYDRKIGLFTQGSTFKLGLGYAF